MDTIRLLENIPKGYSKCKKDFYSMEVLLLTLMVKFQLFFSLFCIPLVDFRRLSSFGYRDLDLNLYDLWILNLTQYKQNKVKLIFTKLFNGI